MSSKKRKRDWEESDDEESYSDISLYNLDSDTKRELNTVKNEIERKEPNIVSILNTPLLLEDKTELFQLFEIYKSQEEFSLEKLENRRDLITKFEQAVVRYSQHNRYSEEEHLQFTLEEKELEQYNEEEELKYDILKLETSKENKRVIYREYKRMIKLRMTDDELPKLKTWLNRAVSLPYDRLKTVKYSSGNFSKFLQTVNQKMDEELYGMKNIKEQILIFLNSRILNPKMKKCSLGLIGPPGSGKTSIVRLLAEIMNFPLEQISLGGVQSSDFLKGHQYTYIGAQPGEIIKCLERMKFKNGILFFDEYDKVSGNKDVCSSLLHITDSTQNNKFQDNYFSGLTFDLSNLWIFYSMNNVPEDDALADRIFYVKIDGYSQQDKFYIVRDYLIRKALHNVGILEEILIEDEAIRYLIEKVSPSSDLGVRGVSDSITNIVNKLNFLYHHQNKKGVVTNFEISFNIRKKLKFPFILKKTHIDLFLA